MFYQFWFWDNLVVGAYFIEPFSVLSQTSFLIFPYQYTWHTNFLPNPGPKGFHLKNMSLSVVIMWCDYYIIKILILYRLGVDSNVKFLNKLTRLRAEKKKVVINWFMKQWIPSAK